MRFYSVATEPEEEGDLSDCERWFPSEKAARRWRRENRETGVIERVELADLPKKELVLRILNGERYVAKREVVATDLPEVE